MIDDSEFYSKVKQGLGMSESSGNYFTPANSSGAMGKYQFIPSRLADLGYPNIDQQKFLSDGNLQETIMDAHMKDIRSKLTSKGIINDQTDPSDVAGYIWAAHLGGIGGAEAVAKGKQGASDSLGTSVNAYFAKGKNEFKRSVGLPTDDEATQRRGFLSAKGEYSKAAKQEAIGPEASLSELFSLGFDAAESQTSSGLQNQVNENTDKVVNSISEVSGMDFKALMESKMEASRFSTFGSLMDQSQDTEKAFNLALQEVKSRFPDVKMPVESFSDVKRLAAEELDIRDANFDKASQGVGWLKWAAGLSGNMLGYMKDPDNLISMLATAPVGGAGIAGIASRAGANFAAEATIVQPQVQVRRDELGLSAGVGQALENAAMAAGGGVALELVGKSASALLRAGSKGMSEGVQAVKMFREKGAKIPENVTNNFEQAKTDMEMNPAGETSAGLDHLDASLDKARSDDLRGQPVNVAKETDGSVFIPSDPARDARVELSAAREGLTNDVQVSKEWEAFKKAEAIEQQEQAARRSIQSDLEPPRVPKATKEAELYVQQSSRSEELLPTIQERAAGITRDVDQRMALMEPTLEGRVSASEARGNAGAEISGKTPSPEAKYVRAIKEEINATDLRVADLDAQIKQATSESYKGQKNLEKADAQVKKLASEIEKVDQFDTSGKYQQKLYDLKESQQLLKGEREANFSMAQRLKELETEVSSLRAKSEQLKSIDVDKLSKEQGDYVEGKSKDLDALVKSIDDLYNNEKFTKQNLITTEDAHGNTVDVPLETFKEMQQEELSFLQQIKDCM